METRIGTYTVRVSDENAPGEYEIGYRKTPEKRTIITRGLVTRGCEDRIDDEYSMARDFLENPGNYNLDWTMVKLIITGTYSDGRPLGCLELYNKFETEQLRKFNRRIEKARL